MGAHTSMPPRAGGCRARGARRLRLRLHRELRGGPGRVPVAAEHAAARGGVDADRKTLHHCGFAVAAAEARVVSQSRFSTPPLEVGSTLIVNRSTTCGKLLTFMSIVNRSLAGLCCVPHCPVSPFTMSFQPAAEGSDQSV